MSTAVLIITLWLQEPDKYFTIVQAAALQNYLQIEEEEKPSHTSASSACFTLCCLQPPANTLAFRVAAQTDALLDLYTCLEV